MRTKSVPMSYVTSYCVATGQGIKDYIRAGWDSAGHEYWSALPQYVLLVGDTQQVPSSSGQLLNHEGFFHVSDNPYADVLNWQGEPGADGFADLALGRIPVTTVADAATAINKILDYDRKPYMPTAPDGSDNWYKNALVASYFEDGALPIEGDPDGKEDIYYFMETAHRVADFLGQDFDYWTDARGSWQSFALAA